MSTSVSSFGARLRELRARAGLSQPKLARLVSFDTSLVSKVETGAVPPSPAFAAACDSALDAEGALLALLPAPVLGPDEEERLALAARAPSRVDAAVVASLATMLAAQRTLEDTFGSTRLLNPVTAQLAVIEDLVREARGPIRPAVLDVAHQWAQFAGWLHTSAGRHDQARAWFDRAMTWAVEADSTDMIATILTFQGHIAWTTGHIGPMISLSQAAQRNRTVFAGQRGSAAQQEARGHAILGDADEMARKTDEAVTLGLRARERDAPPAWMYYHSDAFFEMERGLAHRYLGRENRRHNQRAVELLSSGLAGIPADMRRAEWAGDYVYHLAVAHLQDGDRAAAQHAATEVEAIANATGAPPLTAQARRLRERLNR